MVRVGLALLLLALSTGASAQSLGKAEQLWRAYLGETVRRGSLLLGSRADLVPYWPAVDRLRSQAQSLEPGADVSLVGSWMDVQEGHPDTAQATLLALWPRPAVGRFSVRQWAEALFASWSPSADPQTWTQAWLSWEGKSYSPRALVRGLSVLEIADRSAVGPLLAQAVRLYPEDRRLLPLIARHPETIAAAQGLVARDLPSSGGWSDAGLAALLDHSPSVRPLLLAAGYPASRLDAVASRDYGAWLTLAGAPLADGAWRWDADGDGVSESRIAAQGGAVVSWTKTTEGGQWTLALSRGQPESLTETRGGASWVLQWEAYPWAAHLQYRWGTQTLVYRFPPLAQAVPLWPSSRLTDPARLPAALADLWLPLDPGALAAGASSIETWESGLKLRTVRLYQGQVWLAVEDANRDGVDDTWSYYRAGTLASVYRDFASRGQPDLRELYDEGQLKQVQARSGASAKTEFVVFPQEGVQLWDPHGQSRPLERLFLWSDGDRLTALVFSGTKMPWETMPGWEPPP